MKATPASRASKGFALVITLTLMILLTLLAVGLLSLSSIALRSASQSLAMAEAHTNARVALLLGLGQLQREMGPDRRISAPSGILDGTPDTAAFDDIKHPRLTGVWDAAESPFAKWTLDLPSYDKKAGFRRWLVSGGDEQIRDWNLPKTQLSGGDTAVLAPTAADPVSKRPVMVSMIKGERAGFAWWTSDNGVKATLRAGEKPESNDLGKVLLAARRRDGDGHNAADPRLPTRETGLDQRLVDLPTVDAAIGEKVALESLHDLTTLSETLPVDVTSGGFRKCMNLYLDWLDTQSATGRKNAGTVGKMSGNSAATDYRLFSWDQLRNYESLGRASGMVTLGPGGRPQIRAHRQFGNQPEAEWNPTIGDDRFRIQPVLLKMGFVVSYSTERPPELSSSPKPYALRLHVYPVGVLWNPYNVDLVVPEYCIHAYCPLVFDFNKGRPEGVRVDLTQKQTVALLAFGPESGGAKKTKDLLIPAGGTKVLYPQVVRWQTHPQEHRNSRFPMHYYFWGETGKFNLGDGNFGGVIKNLKGSTESFGCQPANEITGAANDSLTMQISHATDLALGQYRFSFGMRGTHTDWWGNNGPGTDSAETLEKFGQTTFVGNRVEANSPQISLISEAEVPTRTFGQLINKPTPLLFYECFRKAADEDLFPGKYGSFSVAGNPIHALTDSVMGNQDTITPWFESPYTFRFKAINSWFDVTKTFQLPPDTDDRIYFGGSYSPRGQLSVVEQEIPLTPMVSLGQLQHLPLFDYRPVYDPATQTATTQWYGGDYGFHEGRVTQFPQNHAIGNSYASPGIPLDKLSHPGWRYEFNIQVQANHLRTDRSYIANSVLWDTWFCSSMGAQDGVMLNNKRNARRVAEEFLSGETALPNDAITAHTNQAADKVLATLFDTSGQPAKDAYTRVAEYLHVAGGFNVNSVSEEAWMQFLAGLFSRPMLVMESVTGIEAPKVVEPATGRFLISRTTLTNAPPAEQATGKDREDRYWNGCREVSTEQLRELAQAIVRQVKKRGPFLSTAEFVNRRLSSEEELASSGALQAALDDDRVSINAPLRAQTIPPTTSAGKPNYPNPAAAKGSRLQGITGWVTQADLLATLGPSISPRSDTFTIRAMGQTRNAKGEVIATAWCEAVVQRQADYLDSIDDATTATTALKSEVNKTFGRSFGIVSFRWLRPAEVM